MKRITRTERLSADDAAKYKAIRKQVASELPDLIDRHHERMASARTIKCSACGIESGPRS